MPKFEYKANDSSGKLQKGQIEGTDRSDVIKQLQDQKLYIISIKELKEKKPVMIGGMDLSADVDVGVLFKTMTSSVFGVASKKELSLFCKQLSFLIESGIMLHDSLMIVKNQGKNKLFKQKIEEVADDLQKGISFSEAAAKHPNVFPDIFIHLVSSGETGGFLDKALKGLALYFEKEYKIKAKIKSAMIYPAIILSVAVLAIYFILGYVLPPLAKMFTKLDVELPQMTQIVIKASEFVQNYWWANILFFLGVVVVFSLLMKIKGFKYVVHKILLKTPLFGNLLLKSDLSRFTSTLSTLLGNGINIIISLEMAGNVMGNMILTNAILKAKDEITKGEKFSNSIRETKVFPDLTVQMIYVGEESGSMDENLSRLADLYDDEVAEAIARLMVAIEPILMLFVAVIVGFLVVSMFLPMFSLIDNFG